MFVIVSVFSTCASNLLGVIADARHCSLFHERRYRERPLSPSTWRSGPSTAASRWFWWTSIPRRVPRGSLTSGAAVVLAGRWSPGRVTVSDAGRLAGMKVQEPSRLFVCDLPGADSMALVRLLSEMDLILSPVGAGAADLIAAANFAAAVQGMNLNLPLVFLAEQRSPHSPAAGSSPGGA